jgi:hypothetical protein
MDQWRYFYLGIGLYIFQFEDGKSRDVVLEEKLWHIANRPLILRRWVPGMQLLKLSLSSVPVWIKLHNLPMEYWNTACLGHVASGVGNPLCVDSVTEEQRRLAFARVLVEVDVDSDFSKKIDIIDLNEEVIKIGVEYPWLSIKCKKCSLFGHATHTCKKTEKAIWVPRKKEPTHTFFAWTAAQGKILTLDNLKKKRVIVIDRCCMCKMNGESVDHLLLHCKVARALWNAIFSRFSLSWVMPLRVVDLFACWWTGGRSRSAAVWKMVPCCLLWCLWNERNDRQFEDKERTSEELISFFFRSLYLVGCVPHTFIV